MQAFKRFLEWYLGVPATGPGQGTDWKLLLHSPWPAWMPDWLVLLLAVAVLGGVCWIYWRDARTVSPFRRVLLIGLRLSALAFLLFFLTQAALSVDRTGLPFVAVLIDDSASMALEDQYTQPQARRAAVELAGHIGAKELTRLNIAKGLLAGDDGAFVRQLLKRHKLRVYRFAGSAAPLGKGEYLQQEEIPQLLDALQELKADGEQTRPGPAVQKVLADLRGAPPTAIIVLTDGISSTTDADRLSAVSEFARRNSVPLYTVGIGSEEPARDLQLYDLLAEEVAFVGDPISFSAKLKPFGYAGKSVAVTLREKGGKEVLAKKDVRLGADGQPVSIELSHAPKEAGEFEYVVQAKLLPNETNRRNNAESRHVSVRDEKIRVLLVDNVPRYEFRYVKQLLERDRTIELHTILQDADLEYAEEDRTALEHFPIRREDLFQYDVIILGDVHLAYLSSSVLENVREFVRQKGGGLILVAGPRHNPRSFRGTPLEGLLPVELDGLVLPAEQAALTEGFHPELTLEGQKGSGIFRFAESEQDSLQVWNSLPDLYWMVTAPKLKPGAVVLAEHPLRTGDDGRLPVIVMQRYGAGKVLFHATDELWRWRFRVGDLYYARYWVQSIRYLSRSRLIGRDRTAELTADRLVYQQGEAVHLRVRFLDDRFVPAERDGVTVMVERQGDTRRSVKLTQLPQMPSVFEGQFSQAAEGTYRAWVARPSFDEAPPAANFRVEAPQRELVKRSLDRADLVLAAKTSHGQFYSLADAQRLPRDIPRGNPVPLQTADPILLWNRWELLTLFALVLTSEWLLRKKSRLV